MTGIAFTALLANSTMAQTYYSGHVAAPVAPHGSRVTAPTGPVLSFDAYAAEPDFYAASSPDVIENGRIVGADPNPHIRLNLRKSVGYLNF